MDTRAKRPTESVTEQKKSYHSPQLTKYGSVRELTTGSTALDTDTLTSGGEVFFSAPGS